jgi:prepilin signal peptidase PulO-like enzyme (type II secretory pathway)
MSKGKWIGLGDAKLALPLAFMLPILSTFSFIVLSFWIGAGLSIFLLGLQRLMRGGKKHLPITLQQLTMKSEVPFAPFMILAFIVVFWLHIDVLTIMSNIF